jgi:hypothetical protein
MLGAAGVAGGALRLPTTLTLGCKPGGVCVADPPPRDPGAPARAGCEG